MATGFSNSWTSGEICPDAWDRVDLQPIAKGCEEATNLMVRIAGPLAKRRGFWDNGAALEQGATPTRLVRFERSIDDALMLELGDLTVKVWQSNGTPLGVSFASPYSLAQVAGLRFKQVADVIYFRHRDGLPPQTLSRITNSSWSWAVTSFPNGPWRSENADDGFTVALSAYKGSGVAMTASKPLFDPAMVGTMFRVRGRIAGAGVGAWMPGWDYDADPFKNDEARNFALAVCNGRVYRDLTEIAGPKGDAGTNPPVHDRGQASDGQSTWEYVHDGAGVVQVTAVADSTHATVTVLRNLPTEGVLRGSGGGQIPTLNNTDNPAIPDTPFWAEAAYSEFRGWPRMWPTVAQERIVSGATATDRDFVDLTQTAGFTPTTEDYTPGLGTGLVTDVDAVRRRLGDDGGELLWAVLATYPLVGTTSGVHLVGANFVDDPISPAGAVIKQLRSTGSADVYPARAGDGIVFVARGGQTLRRLEVDPSQQLSTEDLSYLATHIADRGFARLAWVPQPEETLWLQLGDGGLAAMVWHTEQQVRGFTRQSLGDGTWSVEDMAVLPGPGGLDTLWLMASRTKSGATQRRLWMLSQKSDALFLDGALLYQGAPASYITGLDVYETETVRVLADGVQYDLPVAGGAITLPAAASKVYAGQKLSVGFTSLKLDLGGAGATMGKRLRVTDAIVSVLTAECRVSEQSSGYSEVISPRTRADFPGAASRRRLDNVNFAADSSRDPRIVITDDTAYDFALYSIRPRGVSE